MYSILGVVIFIAIWCLLNFLSVKQFVDGVICLLINLMNIGIGILLILEGIVTNSYLVVIGFLFMIVGIYAVKKIGIF
jgi:hypothetical protein